MSISCSGLDLEDSVIDLQKWNIKGSSTKIEDKNVSLALVFLVESISDCGGSWLVNDSQNVEAWNCASILCGLSLGVIEIGWYCNDGIFDFLANIGFGDFFHLGQNHRGNLFGMEFLVFSFVFDRYDWFSLGSFFNLKRPVFHIRLNNWIIELSANKSLGIENSVVWVFGCLIFGSITDKSFCFSEGDIWGSGSVTLVIGDDLDSVILPHSYTGVCCTKINSDSFGCGAHLLLIFFDYSREGRAYL